MNQQTQRYLIDGPVGKLEVAIDRPEDGSELRGLAFVAHPHPLFSGTMDNKVAQTLARTFVQLGYLTGRVNFRGVGASEGVHDNGTGEQDDLLALITHLRQDPTLSGLPTVPFVLGGFSFGAFVTTRVAATLAAQGDAAERLVLVGTPAGNWEVATVPEDTIVIHGEQDETIPLGNVFEWARPQDLPVTVLPGADHFFHRKLHIVKRLITEAWRV
jgi:alpha/beta superfamily hydrolase